ncbi:hypothetical protein HAZT_HAZT012021 [Hyalella azteca]|uniref:SH2 domain-containing protein n=1 Tax=Hyalella azteca TaxID=294128 RepID=A0A6A0HBG1_HYAAZ|nr:hypothetical protein HAZT_HAZT012021 [Hyalella azteca]
MAHRSRRRLYETAFDSKVEKPLEEGSSDLLDRIANHPILLLLNPRRRSRQSNNNSSKQKTPHDKNLNIETSDQPSSVHYAYHHDNPILLRSPCPTTVLPKAKFQGSGTPRCGRRGARARVCPPPRSLSSHHLLNSSLRPIGLSKSDDQILNRVSDSPDDEDCFEDYVEGRQAEDLARDLITLHLNADENNRRSSEGSAHSCHVESACGRDTRSTLSTSAAIARVLQGPADCSSAPTIASPASYSQGKSKLSIDEPSASGYSSSRVSPSGKSSLRDLKRSEGLAKLKPLELHSPPGTAPLPVKFIKKPPLSDRSPSSWFSPPRQKDLSLPIKRSSQSRSSSSDASSSDRAPYKSRVKKSSSSTRCEGEKRPTTTPSSARALATNSETSINSSMEVLVDTASESGISMPPHAGAKTSSLSLDSIASGTSSMESLKSSVSEGAGAVGWRNMGSNSSLPLRPSLLLPATHRSLIQSAKFQILSPISDKSQEPSSTDTGGPIVGGMGIVGGGSQHTSPQDLLQQTPLKCRNISEDFRNIHHIIPGPLSGNKGHVGESDSGISIEYGHQSSGSNVLKDLPFDMPKLRRRLAAAHSCPSNSDSSLASCGSSLQQQQQLQQQTPAGLVSVCNPAISRVQACEVQSGTSSSNSSLWEAGSSASSSIEGTPRKAVLSARGSLVLDLGGFNKLVAPTGEEVDVSVPLTKQSWYHGKINKGEAEKLLRCETEGAYLVRSIDTPRWEYSLALKAASGFMHLKIQYHSEANGFKMGRGDQLFPSVPHIVHHHSIHKLPVKGAENMFLVKPIISETL